MAAANAYERKISAGEARDGYIMVLKQQLAFFPPVGEAFTLAADRETRSVAIQAEDCVCRGPEKPHEHYSLTFGGLQAGQRVRISRDGAGRGNYRLEILS